MGMILTGLALFVFGSEMLIPAGGRSLLATALPQTVHAMVEPPADAAELLREIDSLTLPQPERSRLSDASYREEFVKGYREAVAKRGEKILEFVKAFPDHERSLPLMVERWRSMLDLYGVSPEDVGRIANETAARIEAELDPAWPEALRIAGSFEAAMMRLAFERDVAKALEIAEGFVARYPKVRQGAMLLGSVANLHLDSGEADKAKALFQRIVRDYADSEETELYKGKLRRMDAIGQPFELKFTCAITGKEIDVQRDLKGKVVLVDFWATWCGPCVAKMPELKALYEKYRDKGFEIVGVSLDVPEDRGGLKSLRDFVEKNGISWPQYYEGKGFEKSFAESWGIDAIPTLFLLDRQGRLVSTDAIVGLEELVKRYLDQS